jgi:hypothetical protein
LVNRVLLDSDEVLWKRGVCVVSDLKMLNINSPEYRARLIERAFKMLAIDTVDVKRAGECARHFCEDEIGGQRRH